MSEITKLYENAGIKPYIYCSKPQLDCDARETGNCKQDCEYYSGERLLTPFTAEKQLEIVKQILFSTWWMNLKRLQFSEKFDEGLAQMINDLWQSLTEEERQQVKGILE